MKIESKFDIGQTVYVIEESKCYEDNIERIIIEKSYGKFKVRYQTELDICPKEESDCFATEAEALAECEKRNKGENK